MIWLAGGAGYVFAVWMFLRFFHFVSEVDHDAERMQESHSR